MPPTSDPARSLGANHPAAWWSWHGNFHQLVVIWCEYLVEQLNQLGVLMLMQNYWVHARLWLQTSWLSLGCGVFSSEVLVFCPWANSDWQWIQVKNFTRLPELNDAVWIHWVATSFSKNGSEFTRLIADVPSGFAASSPQTIAGFQTSTAGVFRCCEVTEVAEFHLSNAWNTKKHKPMIGIPITDYENPQNI